MPISNKYFHDKVVLLLLSVNSFLALLESVLILLRLSGSHGDVYIIQYHANLGINHFKKGSYIHLLDFIWFALLAVAFHWFLSMRVYPIRRQLAISILGFGLLLLVLSLIVSNALLLQHS